jgi:tetratricopeptide (TPR) repeat protein
MAIAAIAGLLTAGAPLTASAQSQAKFTDALVRLATAAGGSFGDEGPQLAAAIEAMALAVGEQDEQLRSLGAQLAGAAHPAAAQIRVELGRQYMARGKTADAIRELETASQLDVTRADVHLLRALAYQAADRHAEADAAFRTAYQADRSNPVSAYWMVEGGRGSSSAADRLRAIDTLAAVYRTADRRQPRTFFTFGSMSHAAFDAPLALPAAYAQAYSQLTKGDVASALDGFRKAAAIDPLMTDPARALAPLAEGSAALRQGRPTVARERFQAVLARIPNSAEAHRLLGVAHWANRDFDTSIEEFVQAVRLQPADERARIMLARVLVETGAPLKAEGVLRQTLDVLPQSTYARLWLGAVYEALNQRAEAAASYEAAAPWTVSGRPGLYAVIAQLREGWRDSSGVIDALAVSVRLNPNDAATHNALGRSYREHDRLDESLAEHVAALLVDPASAEAYMGIGQLHLNAGRYAEATVVLERLVRLQPGYAEGHYALANALQRSGRAEEGGRELAEFQKLLTQKTEDRRRTMALGVIKEEAALRSSEGAWDRAIALWQQAIDQEPGSASNHAALAEALAGAGRLDPAVQQYERAAALGGSADVYRQLAALYGKLGRSDDSARARDRYAQALLVPVRDGGRP